MKRFIIKALAFTLPFFLLYLLNLFFYDINDGDLTRIGYLYSNPTPNKSINEVYRIKKKYTQISSLDLSKKHQFDVLVIGDSFSDQDSLGYQNFLADKGISVLDMDKKLYPNPIHQLAKLANGNFFDNVKTDFVILESVERNFTDYATNSNFLSVLNIETLKQDLKLLKKEKHKNKLDFFSETTIKVPLTNILYQFQDKPQTSKTYKTSTLTNNLFSNQPDHVLFFEDDLLLFQAKNDSLSLQKSNQVLNKIYNQLKKKNITLIVVIAPDKYDLYYSYIKDKTTYPQPIFSHRFNELPKDYNYLKSFEALSSAIKKKKNVYYYADTHWSPIGAKIIADELHKIIKTQSNY